MFITTGIHGSSDSGAGLPVSIPMALSMIAAFSQAPGKKESLHLLDQRLKIKGRSLFYKSKCAIYHPFRNDAADQWVSGLIRPWSGALGQFGKYPIIKK
jgi:hypothetical protein